MTLRQREDTPDTPKQARLPCPRKVWVCVRRLLTERDVYKGKQPCQLPRALLLMAENFSRDDMLPSGDLQIEHILPVNPESGW